MSFQQQRHATVVDINNSLPTTFHIHVDFELMYDVIRTVHSDVIKTGEIIRGFVAENRSEFDKFLQDFQRTTQSTNEKLLASDRESHAEWFDGVPASVSTKEEVMARRSQDRIRGYFYKTKEDLIKSDIYKRNKSARPIIDNVVEMFRIFLTGTDYFSTLFDRKCPNKHRLCAADDDEEDEADGEPTPRKKFKQAVVSAFQKFPLKEDYCVSLCTDTGEFRCHGLWDGARCTYPSHCINPYSSRENVILFQIWNLDHQIEISRAVIPSLLEQIRHIADDEAICMQHKRPAETISVLRYFLELFTMENLKLVHIVCHDKGSHALQSRGGVICKKCDEYKTLEKILQRIGVRDLL